MTGSGELAMALRRWRDRITPERAGLANPAVSTERRRAVGLRREEVAFLSGVSVDYITRLEQGRATSPSPPVLAGLARALRLSDAEREHLYLVAGHQLPRVRRSQAVVAGAQSFLEQLDGVAASGYDAAWTLVAWNRRWSTLCGEPAGPWSRQRNVAWLQFMNGGPAVVHSPDQQAALETALVSDLRKASIRYPEDRELSELIEDLRAGSARFAELWDAYVVAVHATSRKTILHPDAGALTLDCHILTAFQADLRIVTLAAAPGTETAERIQSLYVSAGC
ncbi:helix-turn-helix transcriptional regulator [Streptomyces sp. NPDC059906]|uniref:helix-turn-helix transcriptional regulator n=1 Tax=Streptomyces sp. NPDC059906 TaxID=3346997 RepID=UPI003662B9AE